ncbi:SH2 domain-containing protein 1A isoform X2 [Hippoglossus stenolepis]|uniref:SH2 domain-containing protein 1A isoform X2 n=1 Tax=Hippoglossus stenolepis TaxID=195615 RepID=UPI00159C4216|nr:SH2 domain-containing protein 1A isoform X2 [Hippoglossus stenolepis]
MSAGLRGDMEQEGELVRSIYFGRIGSEATERLLERFGRDGSFLLRDSDTMQGAYCLCVRKAPFVHTFRLVHSIDGWCPQSSGIRRQSFGTLETLIENYRGGSASGVTTVPLTHPLDRTQLQYISNGQEFVYMEMSRGGGGGGSGSGGSSSGGGSSRSIS